MLIAGEISVLMCVCSGCVVGVTAYALNVGIRLLLDVFLCLVVACLCCLVGRCVLLVAELWSKVCFGWCSSVVSGQLLDIIYF